MEINFYKEIDGRWYSDIPQWPGTKEELEMVYGADTMLNIISEGSSNVSLRLDPLYFEGSNKLLLRKEDPLIGGGWYMLEQYCGIEFNLKLWLCDVVKFVFGNIPKEIYFTKIDKLQ